MLQFPRRRTAAILALVSLAACADAGAPVAPLDPDLPGTPVELTQVSCTARVAQGSLSCGAPAAGGARGDLLVGGQGQYVQVTSSNVAYDAGTSAFTFDVTVQNLIPQPLGTTNGTTGAASGVRLFFAQAPTVTDGTGSATVANADGTATFTATGQPYFQYAGALLGADGILSPNETSSAKGWTITVPSTANTFEFTLYVAAEVPFPDGWVEVTPAVDTVLAGATVPLTATVRSAVGNVIPGQTVTWGTSNAAIASVDGSTATAVAPGRATLTATAGTRTGTATLDVCPNLAVGGSFVSTSATLCLGAGEYVVVPSNLGTSSTTFSFTGNGIVPVSGTPTPNLIPGGRSLEVRREGRPDDAYHIRHMERQRESVRSFGRADLVRESAARPRFAIVPGVPAVGATMTLNVSDFACTNLDNRVATVRAVGEHIIILEDNSNPTGGPTTADYQEIATTFDTLVYETVTAAFGEPEDLDNNGRVIALYTAAVNDLSTPNSGSYVGGFFFSRDMYSAASCPGSNMGEMMYMLAADPNGVHGNDWTVDFIKEQTIGTLGHELEHLINSSRRLYENPTPASGETVWLDEGLAHIAEELIYYRATGRAPGQNVNVNAIAASQRQIDLFLAYGEANFGRLRSWMINPHSSGPFSGNDALSVRGASWAFLRYAADRRGGDQMALWNALAIGPQTGVSNLQNRLGTDPRPWYRDWATSMYFDDAVPGIASIHNQPSWNFRSVYGALGYGGMPPAFPLAPRNPTNGVATSFTMAGGGSSAFLRVGVPAASFAGLTTTTPTAVPTTSSYLAVVVTRRK